MPRPAKITQQKQATPLGVSAELLREIEAEAGQWSEVSQATRLAYEANGRQLSQGWDLGLARKNTRYVMRASGLWVMRRQLRRKMAEAKKLLKSGLTGQELAPIREAMWAEKVREAEKLLREIQEFKALPWKEIDDPKAHFHEADHKKKPATDAELVAFFGAAERSQFRNAFLVAEFSGCRGDELGKGVRVELIKTSGTPTLRFFIEGAKCDGERKGLELRSIECPFPSEASKDVQRRWLELAKLVSEKKSKEATIRVEPSAKQAPGVRFTQACKDVAKSAGVKISAYSLRHRFSAQVKAANPGDAEAVALALGHQTTETQRHYARAARGRGGISPVKTIGVKVVGMPEVRGAKTRAGPKLHTKEKVALAKVVGSAPSASPRPSPRRL